MFTLCFVLVSWFFNQFVVKDENVKDAAITLSLGNSVAKDN